MMFDRRKSHGPKMMQGRGCSIMPLAMGPMGGPAPRPRKHRKYRRPMPMGCPGPKMNHNPMSAQGRGCFMM